MPTDAPRANIFDAKIKVLMAYKELERALADGGCADEALKVDKRVTAMTLRLNEEHGIMSVITAQQKFKEGDA